MRKKEAEAMSDTRKYAGDAGDDARGVSNRTDRFPRSQAPYGMDRDARDRNFGAPYGGGYGAYTEGGSDEPVYIPRYSADESSYRRRTALPYGRQDDGLDGGYGRADARGDRYAPPADGYRGPMDYLEGFGEANPGYYTGPLPESVRAPFAAADDYASYASGNAFGSDARYDYNGDADDYSYGGASDDASARGRRLLERGSAEESEDADRPDPQNGGGARRSRPVGKSNLARYALLALLVISAVFLGVWVTEKYVSPLMVNSKTDGAAAQAESASKAADSNVLTASDFENSAETSESADLVDTDMSIGAWSIYVVQSGSYTDSENADNAAREIRDIGGAGYIIKDADNYRVMATAFSNEYDADLVRQSLTSDVYSALVYKLSFGDISFTVSAREADAKTISGAIAQWPELIKTTLDVIRKCETGEMTGADTVVAVKEITAQLTNTSEALKAVPGTDNSGFLKSLSDMYAEAASVLSDVTSQTTIEPGQTLGRVKYAYIGMCWDYRQLVEEIAASKAEEAAATTTP